MRLIIRTASPLLMLICASLALAQEPRLNAIDTDAPATEIARYPLIGCDSPKFKAKPALRLEKLFEDQGSWVDLNLCIEPAEDDKRRLTAGVLDFISHHEELRMLGHRRPMIIADGRALLLNDKSATASEKNAAGQFKEVASMYVSFEEFLRLAGSDKVEVLMGDLRFEMLPEHKKAVREFAGTFSAAR